jgi:uncharacterized repeat protein (TIGR01451 family)
MIRFAKTATPSPATPGTTVTYTITTHNAGTADYSASAPATFADDISATLHDSAFDIASLSASAGTAAYAPTTHVISWSGPLGAGATATVTYTVTVDDPDTGDHSMTNRVVSPDPSNCETTSTDPDCRTTVDVPDLEVAKSADPADGDSVVAGQVITFTLTFQDIGKAAAAVDFTDDLGDVLDDATVTRAPAASSTDLSVGPIAHDKFEVTGTVPTGATDTVTYQVTIRPDGQGGNDAATNFLTKIGQTHGPGCSVGDPLCTRNLVRGAGGGGGIAITGGNWLAELILAGLLLAAGGIFVLAGRRAGGTTSMRRCARG